MGGGSSTLSRPGSRGSTASIAMQISQLAADRRGLMSADLSEAMGTAPRVPAVRREPPAVCLHAGRGTRRCARPDVRSLGA